MPSQDRDQLESNSELSDQGVLSNHEGRARHSAAQPVEIRGPRIYREIRGTRLNLRVATLSSHESLAKSFPLQFGRPLVAPTVRGLAKEFQGLQVKTKPTKCCVGFSCSFIESRHVNILQMWQ